MSHCNRNVPTYSRSPASSGFRVDLPSLCVLTCEVHLFSLLEHGVAAGTSGTAGVVAPPSSLDTKHGQAHREAEGREGSGVGLACIHLQDAAADVPAAAVAPDPELGMVVGLTVRNPVPARDREERGSAPDH